MALSWYRDLPGEAPAALFFALPESRDDDGIALS
jgi:hypothetical protein